MGMRVVNVRTGAPRVAELRGRREVYVWRASHPPAATAP